MSEYPTPATFIGFEAVATAIEQFEIGMVPGFLQTADYGRAYLNGADTPDNKEPPKNPCAA